MAIKQNLQPRAVLRDLQYAWTNPGETIQVGTWIDPILLTSFDYVWSIFDAPSGETSGLGSSLANTGPSSGWVNGPYSEWSVVSDNVWSRFGTSKASSSFGYVVPPSSSGSTTEMPPAPSAGWKGSVDGIDISDSPGPASVTLDLLTMDYTFSPAPGHFTGSPSTLSFSASLIGPVHALFIDLLGDAIPPNARNIKLCVSFDDQPADKIVPAVFGSDLPGVTEFGTPDGDGAYRMPFPYRGPLSRIGALPVGSNFGGEGFLFGLTGHPQLTLRLDFTDSWSKLKVWREYDIVDSRPRSRVTQFSTP